MAASQSAGKNGRLVTALRKLASSERAEGEAGKAKAYDRAADSISDWPERIISGQQARDDKVPGVGPGVAARIDEILSGSAARSPARSASKSPAKGEIPATNLKIADVLRQIAAVESAKGEQFKAEAFTKAAVAIGGFAGRIKSGADAKAKISGGGIGKSTMEIIDEVLETGTSSRLEAAKGGKEEVITQFMSYYGIGKVAADRFYQLGYRTKEDLLRDAILTRAQRLGLEWSDQIAKPIPREEMEEFLVVIDELLANYRVEWQLGGSFARGAATSGDLDVLAVMPSDDEKLDLNGLVLALTPILQVKLDQGSAYFKGIARLPGRKRVGRRIDLSICTEDELPFALLHSIGSGPFNRLLRQHAKEMGYTLNQHGLWYSEDQTRVEDRPFMSDKDIFAFLGVAYIPPNERTKDITKLKLVARRT